MEAGVGSSDEGMAACFSSFFKAGRGGALGLGVGVGPEN